MPFYKFIANRFLTWFENLTLRLNLSEYHTGMRAFKGEVLKKIAYLQNSNDFVFDSEVLAQISSHKFRVGEVPIPCRYFKEASEINAFRSTIYGLQTLWVGIKLFLHQKKLKTFAQFN